AKLEKAAPNQWPVVDLKARLLKARQQPDEAAALVATYARRKGANLALAADLLDEFGQLTAAEQLYRKHAAAGNCPDATLSLARNLGRQRRVGEALDLCDKVWDRCAIDLVAQSVVGILRNGRGSAEQIGRVDQRLTAACQQTPDVVGLLIAVGDLRDL